ncbi:dihydroneopterin aldolase [Flavobacteriaceae bacterium]|nr:dihydroneopterin aldolase [Flavobacteriaceae bacterium]MDB2463417.1 dihydroneopterin aldolase [Flavobacteriaceae bacterium]
MGEIKLKDIRVYAHHGCLPEETIIGSDYLVQLHIGADLTSSALSDRLEETADYVLLHKIVEDQMKVPSKLLEHVALRINQTILKEVACVQWSEVTVSKINPPIGGDVDRVSIILRSTRDNLKGFS